MDKRKPATAVTVLDSRSLESATVIQHAAAKRLKRAEAFYRPTVAHGRINVVTFYSATYLKCEKLFRRRYGRKTRYILPDVLYLGNTLDLLVTLSRLLLLDLCSSHFQTWKAQRKVPW